MASTYSKLFQPTVLAAAAGTLYTVPATPTGNLLRGARLRFTNTTAGAVTVTAYAVPSGGSVADGNAFLKGFSVGANNYIDIDVPTLAAGDSIQALAGAATSITAHALTGFLQS